MVQPEWNHETAMHIEQEIIDKDQQAKGKRKSYAVKRRHTKECDILSRGQSTSGETRWIPQENLRSCAIHRDSDKQITDFITIKYHQTVYY